MWSIGVSPRVSSASGAGRSSRPGAWGRAEFAGAGFELAGDEFRQRRFAVAVGAEQGDAVVHVDAQAEVAQDRRAAVADRDAVDREDRGRELGVGEGEFGGAVFEHRLDDGEAAMALMRACGLAGLGGLGAEAIDEGLHVRLRGDTAGHGGLLGGTLGLDADEFVVAGRVTVILPRSRWAMLSTQRSSRLRSCETTRAAPGNLASQVSSHMVASRSRWLVGSSSRSMSGAENSTVASATRMRQPPE
jgi:hypothetical protein